MGFGLVEGCGFPCMGTHGQQLPAGI